MSPPVDLIPEEIWADVVRKLGDLVIAECKTVKAPCGAVAVGFVLISSAVRQVRALLIEHGATFSEGDQEEGDGPWSEAFAWDSGQDPDAWKA